ncbi:MAG: DMT family transporter [Anaerolineales bacterium]|nr:DMT family transporter [Anaerolineales bacterium]
MKTKDWLAFIGLSLAWGTSFFWIKIALEEVGPFLLVAYRILFGLLALALVLLWTRPQWPRDRRSYIAMLILGLTNTAVPFVLFSWAELHVDSAVASIFNSSMPLFTMIIAHVALSDDRLTRQRVLGLLVGFVGVVVLALRDTGGDVRMNLLAQGALLLAVLFYAGSTVFARQTTKGIVPTVQAFVPLVMADLVIWSAAQAAEAPLRLPQLPMTWVALLWMGVVGSCMAYLFYYYLLHSVGPTRLAMVTYMFPVVGVTMGVLFLNERLDASLIIGALLVLLSLYIVNRPTGK